ncbi:MAG: DUF3592 domain-containing protein [Streptosporangiales bacterium]
MDDLFTFFPYVFLAAGLIGFAMGAYSLTRFALFHRRALRAPGTVVDIKRMRKTGWQPGSDTGNRYRRYAVLSFHCQTGRDLVTTSINPIALTTAGQEVEVYYDPHEPTRAYLGRGVSSLVSYATAAVGGIMITLVGWSLVAGGSSLASWTW